MTLVSRNLTLILCFRERVRYGKRVGGEKTAPSSRAIYIGRGRVHSEIAADFPAQVRTGPGKYDGGGGGRRGTIHAR